ncbi:TonB family protein [Sodalis sp. dw_96]|uniref:TonB family protein n=1 Tax=Sodalis sp. dw_96 TaxID=2719794 RepID=UPI001BD5CB0D|nr:TonB family protein [Sodalis sp. dw_96]
MALNILKTTRRFMWPYVVSVGLHTSLVAGLLYASINRISPSIAVEQPMSVTLVAPAPQPVAAPAPPPPVPPQPVESPKPAPEPEPKPEPVVEPPAPVQLPKPKPKPRPVIKKEAKPRPHKEPVPIEQARTDAPPRDTPLLPAPPQASAPAVSAAKADTGPVALSRPDPDYPDRARALGIEGRVQIQFDVNADGQVENLRIISATPPNMFERDIREVTRRWRYQSGKPGKNVNMSIVFELTGVRSHDH